MAIKRYHVHVRTFEFEGLRIGVREARTSEMLEITRLRQQYLKTVKENPYGDGDGDINLFIQLQRFISGMLACDPENGEVKYFADDVEEQKKLGAAGVHKDTLDDVPHRLHAEVWNIFKNPLEWDADQAEKAKAAEADPLATQTKTITDASASSSSGLASTLEPISTPSETGTGAEPASDSSS